MPNNERRPRVRLEAVGYGRPPRGSQFKPGQSGNPKGRPKGKKNEATILKDRLYRTVTIREGAGRSRRVTFLEAILLRFMEAALKGDIKSAVFILTRLRDAADAVPTDQSMNEDDLQILDSFAQRLLTQARRSQS